MNAYNGTLLGQLESMTQYKTYWGITDLVKQPEPAPAMLYFFGGVIGALFAGPASDTWGRKVGMAIACVCTVIGTCLNLLPKSLVMDQEYNVFRAGRFIMGFGNTINTTAAPAYVIEMAHPLYRGTIGGLYNAMWFSGSVLNIWICYFTQKVESDWSWRIPIYVGLLPTLLLMIGLCIIPESPRWLVGAGLTEKARQVLVKYHANGNDQSELVIMEFNHMCETIRTDASDKRFYDYSELVNTRPALYRLFMTFLIAFFGQWSGNAIFTYQPQLGFTLAGVEPQYWFMLNGIQSVTQLLIAIWGARSADRFGRRPMVVWGTIVLSFCMGIVTVGMYFGKNDSNASKSVGSYVYIIGQYLYQFVYALSWTPQQVLYPVECLASSTRAKGMSIFSLFTYASISASNAVVYDGVPALNWKFYLIFVGWDLIEAAVLYFCMVETKGLTLEELDQVFSDHNPRKTSLRIKKEIEESLTEEIE
ncbi:hypothetical protein HDV00_002650 [Rhizophlyctis rosea]|nr:hypothetical protein HDV00_002650 [Rhizophlyctis rosea]